MIKSVRPEDIIDKKQFLIEDAECVDHANDYKRVIENILKLAGGKFELTSFVGTEQTQVRRLEISINEHIQAQINLEGDTDWLDLRIIRRLNEILKDHLGDYKFAEFRDTDWGQEIGVAYVNNAQWQSFVDAGLIHELSETPLLKTDEKKDLPAQANTDNLMPAGYEEVGKFHEGLAAVKKDGKYGFVDINNTLVIPIEYENGGFFSNGFAAVKRNGKYGFIDKVGRERTPFIYDDTWGVAPRGHAFVYLNGRWSAIDMSGTVLATFDYDQLCDFFKDSELINVQRGGKWGCIDRDFREIIPCIYNYWLVFSEGLAPVTRSLIRKDDPGNPFERISYVDTNGKEIIPYVFDEGGLFKGGLASVRSGNKWGYINSAGEIVIPVGYDSAGDFSDGFAIVELNGRTLRINTKGEKFPLRR